MHLWILLFATFAISSGARADDCEQIREGIRQLPPHGGVFHIPAGEYVCDAPIFLDRDNIGVDGDGQVKIRLADNANAPLIVLGSILTPPPPVSNVSVANLSLDGNMEHQQMECWGGPCDTGGTTPLRNNGISVRAAIGAKVTDVVVRGARSGGLVSELGTYGLQVDGLSSSGNFFDGLAACKTYDSVYKRLHLFHNQSAGISTDLDFRGNEIHEAIISENRDVGIFMRYSSENLYENVRVENSFSHGIFMAAAWGEPDCAKDNEFRNLTVVNSGGYGILLHDPCQGNRLTGNPDFQGNELGCLGLVDGATFGLPLGFQCSVQSWLKRNAPSFL